ncbi:hypothetical protein [Phenylobacterium sp.]|uniref:hypothetical protein n=1 Tax=Phenylobacterium sp. TaxID=1871053 RepID=UPI0035B07E1B
METEDAVLMDAGDGARVDDDAGLGAGGDELVEIEHDGRIYQAPAALKGALMRHADYTRKTQELAEQRRALEAHRRAFHEQAEGAQAQMMDQARMASLDETLAEFQGVDWELYASQDPQGAQALWAQYQAFLEGRERLAWMIAHRGERQRLQAERALSERLAETGQVLSQQIEGWSPEVAMKLVDYAQAFGVTLDELREAADPRLWQILHRAQQGDELARQQQMARTVEQAQAVRPAVQVTGSAAGGGGVRDELGTAEWMKRRNAQAVRGR